jgi:putative peptidoglycan lipid II flippase
MRSRPVLRRLSELAASPVLRVLIGTGLIAVVCKLIGFAREVVVASTYGATEALDAYLVAIALANLMFNAISGAIGAALLPRLLTIRQEQGPGVERAAQQRATFWTVLVMAAAGTACATAAPWFLPWMSPGFSAATRNLAASLIWGVVPYCVLSGVAQVWAILANSEGRFAVTAATPGIVSTASILVLIATGPTASPWPLVIGLTFGAACDLAVTGKALFGTRYSLVPKGGRWSSFEAGLIRNIWPLSLGAILHAGTFVVDQAMASLVGPGTISELNYGNRLVAMVISLFGLTINRVAFPEFSRFAAAKAWPELRTSIRRYAVLTCALGLPAMVILAAAARPIVTATFRRGQFTTDVAGSVALIQAMFALQIPFYLVGTLIVRAAMALEMNRLTLFIGCGTVVGNAAINMLLMGPLGAPGIALGTSTVYLGTCIVLSLMVHREIRRRELASNEISHSVLRAA